MQNRLKELRHEKNLTLRELGEKVGMRNSTLSQYENNKREPKLKTWQKLADFFNVPVDYLLGISKDRSTLTIDDLNTEEQEAYEHIRDTLSQEYPQTRPEFNWSKIGQLLINSDIAVANLQEKKDKVEQKLNEAGEKLVQYLVKDLGVNPADIALYAMLKVVLDKD